MKIKKKTRQHRRDFWAIYECEHCGYEDEEPKSGYDDSYFHNHVIPDMECPECEKKAGDDYQPRATKYPDSMTV